MHCHPNAALTPRGRAKVFTAVEAGMTVSAACLAFGVSRRFYHRWLPRWRARGHAGLVDHGSRPRSSPQRLPSIDEARIVALRRSLGWGADRLGALLGLPASTCHRVLDRQGLIVRTREREPANRCEHEHPGDLLHLDTKKLGRIVGLTGLTLDPRRTPPALGAPAPALLGELNPGGLAPRRARHPGAVVRVVQ